MDIRIQDEKEGETTVVVNAGVGLAGGALGVLFTLGGILYGSVLMGWIDAELLSVQTLWPVIPIFIGVQATRNTRGAARVIAVILTLVAFNFLGVGLGIVSDPWANVAGVMSSRGINPDVLWAGLLVLVGVFFLSGTLATTSRNRSVRSASTRPSSVFADGSSAVGPSAPTTTHSWSTAHATHASGWPASPCVTPAPSRSCPWPNSTCSRPGTTTCACMPVNGCVSS